MIVKTSIIHLGQIQNRTFSLKVFIFFVINLTKEQQKFLISVNFCVYTLVHVNNKHCF